MNKFHVNRQTKRQWYRLIVKDQFQGYIVAPDIEFAKTYANSVFNSQVIVVNVYRGAVDSPIGIYNEDYVRVYDENCKPIKSKSQKTKKSGSFVNKKGDWKWRNEDGSVQDLW